MRESKVSGRLAQERPELNDLQPRYALSGPRSVPGTGRRRDRRAAARRAAKSPAQVHEELTRPLRLTIEEG